MTKVKTEISSGRSLDPLSFHFPQKSPFINVIGNWYPYYIIMRNNKGTHTHVYIYTFTNNKSNLVFHRIISVTLLVFDKYFSIYTFIRI